MAPFRILVVDDSVVIRKLLCETLSADHELEVVGTAPNGNIALAKFSRLLPDLITLDVEMPVLNGLETLAAIRRLDQKIPVIMFSTVTDHGAAATVEALLLGASDYANKPSGSGSMAGAIEVMRSELIPKIKALCRRAVMSSALSQQTRRSLLSNAPSLPAPPRSPKPVPTPFSRTIEIVAIGTSTGGPNALMEVVPRIPKDFPVPIVLVQHMPPIFTLRLAERLASRSEIKVAEGIDGTILSPGNAWIAPGNFHMTVKRSGTEIRLEMNQLPPENSCRPAVDVLFRSVAKAYRANVLAVVMTGMGSDGVIGAQSIRQAGGEVIIQDEASSVVWGMPGAVHGAGQADAVYALDQLAAEITHRVLRRRAHADSSV